MISHRHSQISRNMYFRLSLDSVLKCTVGLNSRINEMNLYFGILQCSRWPHLKGFHIYNCTCISPGQIKVAVIAGWPVKNEVEVVDEIWLSSWKSLYWGLIVAYVSENAALFWLIGVTSIGCDSSSGWNEALEVSALFVLLSWNWQKKKTI